MSNWVIAFLFGLGASAWIYAKLARSNGNATPSQNVAGAAIAGIIAFVFVFTLLEYVLNL